MLKRVAMLAGIVCCVWACSDHISVEGNWIKGTPSNQLHEIESQFRGFDKTMVELGYRYTELYWAGKSAQWAYADYQLKKIQQSMQLGIKRRPKRAASAVHFTEQVLPSLQQSLKKKDTLVFEKSFIQLQQACNNCHVMEKVPFFKVGIPQEKNSPIFHSMISNQ